MRICFAMARGQRLLAAAGAVTVMLVAGCTVSTGGSGSSPAAGSSAQPPGSAYSLPAGVQTLKVSNPAGTVRVTAANGSAQVRVAQQPTGKPTAYRQAAGSTAAIGSRCPGGTRTGDCHMDYQIQMPPSVALDVAGEAGQVILHGGLTKAQVNTRAGRVSGTGLGRGSFTVATQAGEVDLGFAAAPTLAKVTTQAGTISATVPRGGSYKVSASSDAGSQDIKVPDDPNAASIIDLRAQVGSVSLDQG